LLRQSCLYAAWLADLAAAKQQRKGQRQRAKMSFAIS
jgi:hypothetical protein